MSVRAEFPATASTAGVGAAEQIEQRQSSLLVSFGGVCLGFYQLSTKISYQFETNSLAL
jgi:hypothetical protein